MLLDQPQVHVFFGMLVITLFNYVDFNLDKGNWIAELCEKTGTILQSVAGNRLILKMDRVSLIREVLGGNMQIENALIRNTLDIARRNDNGPMTTVCKNVCKIMAWTDMPSKC